VKVVPSIEALATLGLARPWVTWGIFDGVHRGHQALLKSLREGGGPTAVITFDPHPQEVLFGREVRLLASPELRLKLLEQAGIDACAVQKFSREFSEQEPEAFFKRQIAALLRPAGVILGYDSAFGRDRRGNLELTERWGRELGVTVRSCPPLDVGGAPVSSGRIRDALGRGDVAEAADLLGRPYRLIGRVVPGRRRGRSVGFPTCNLEHDRQAVPRTGVYGGRASVAGRAFDAVVNVGFRPTFETAGAEPLVEAHLLDCADLDAYGERLELDFWVRIRDEMKFDGADALRAQIARDIEAFGAARRSSKPV
jgi:riboflavin kinase/FMN adenylyltransferase